MLSLAGCKTLGEHSIDHNFPGITKAMDKPIICLLFVHGIGGYSNDDPKHIIDSISKMPSIKQTAPEHPVPLTGTDATLTRQDFVDSSTGHELRAYTLEWEPVTIPLKKQYLAYDQDESIKSRRLPIDNDIRAALMDDGMPDVVLYVGQYKSTIQRAVKQALKQMHKDIEAREDKTRDYEYVFVTWSLGSKIVFDCLAAPGTVTTQSATADTSEEEYTFNRIAEKTHSVFMLANQIPLLTLGDVKSKDQAHPYEALLSVAKRRKLAAATQPAELPLSIVAFSDPNDLLSFPIPTWLETSPDATFANVSISVATTAYYIPFVGWILNPDTAHTAYGIRDNVVNLILNGGTGDVTK